MDIDTPRRRDDPAPLIKSPCPMSWNAMQGDDRRRHCGSCNLFVHDLARHRRSETTAILQSDGRTCARVTRIFGRVLYAPSRRVVGKLWSFVLILIAALLPGCVTTGVVDCEYDGPPPRSTVAEPRERAEPSTETPNVEDPNVQSFRRD